MNMAWCQYEIHLFIRGLGRMNGMDSTWKYKWGWIVQVGMKYIHMHVKYYLFDYDWSLVSA